MVSKRLTRLLKKHFAISDPENAFCLLQFWAGHHGDAPAEVLAVLSGLPQFLGSIDDGYREFDERLKIALRNLDLSSEELNAINFQMERLNVTMRAMMESLGQGLLFFDRKGICAPVYSRACRALLETDPSGRHICDVLRLDPEKRAAFEPLIGLLFDEESMALSFDDLIALAPQFYAHSEGLSIALSYKAMHGASGSMRGILLVATDITQKLQAQEKLKQKEEQVLRTLRIAGNRASYVHFLHGLEAVFRTMEGAASPADVKRDLHTLKGMANVFYLRDLAHQIHELEDRLRDLPRDGWRAEFSKILAERRVRLDLGLEYAHWLGREIWGMEFETAGDVISIGTGELAAFGADLRRAVAENAPPGAVERMFFERVASQDVMDLLSFFETQLGYFAEMAGRQVRIVREEGDRVRVFPGAYRGFFDSLTHVARNIIDHAFEPAPLRAMLGKPPDLHVRIRARYNAARDGFTVAIADDGQGISFDKVTRRMKEKNRQRELEGKSQEDVLQHIFDEDFSTRSGVTMTSGRGTGMNVVKAETERLGGSLRVESQEGAGTTLTVSLPLLWHAPAA